MKKWRKKPPKKLQMKILSSLLLCKNSLGEKHEPGKKFKLSVHKFNCQQEDAFLFEDMLIVLHVDVDVNLYLFSRHSTLAKVDLHPFSG